MSTKGMDDRGNALENEYFHRKEKELIEKMRVKLGSETTSSTDLQCPKCDGILHETDFETLRIDVCNKCNGVWLDAGELTQITQKDEGGWFSRVFG